MENVTGSRFIYGLDTPISMLDIMNGAGIITALECFYAATTDVTILAGVIGFAFCSAYQTVWDSLTLDADSRYAQIIYLAGLLQDVQISTGRLDYCGDPIDSAGAVSVAQIEDRIDSLQNTADNISTVMISPTYPIQAGSFQFFYNTDGLGNRIPPVDIPIPNGQGGNLLPSDLVSDPILSEGAGLPPRGYIETNIVHDLSLDPDFFLKEVLNSFAHKSPNPQWGTWYPLNRPSVPNNVNMAISAFANAAALAAQQVTAGNENLAAIGQLIQQGVANYAISQRLILSLQMNYLIGVGTGAGTPYAPFPGSEAIATQIIAAENASIITKLRNVGYVSSFDTDFSAGLSASEFEAMLTDLNGIMKTARGDSTLPFFQGIQAQFYDYVNMTADLETIFATYIT